MIRTFAIKGTNVKMDIEMCSQCPLLAFDRDAMPDGCGLMRDQRYYEDSIDPNCPLPIRIVKPDCYYRVGVQTGQCAVCEWFKECPMQGHGEKVKP